MINIILAVACALHLAIALIVITSARTIIARQRNLIELLQTEKDSWFQTARARSSRITELQAELAPFRTYNRVRGRFARKDAA